MTGSRQAGPSRRTFLKALAAAIGGTAFGGCAMPSGVHEPELPRVGPAQKAWRKQGPSTVVLLRCESYEEDLSKMLKQGATQAGAPALTGKTVLIKPNMVEYRPGRPLTTNQAVVAAAVELADWLGAREIVVAEGPGHFRDTQFLLEATGIGAALKKLGIRFVDLNLDRLEKFDNSPGLTGHTDLKDFFLPQTVAEADAVISVPKMKTHHWVGMTASMKNLFGTVPGRKYGWPKNILHWAGIEASIMDLVHLVHPVIGIVDGIVAMEGDGPINGTARRANLIAMGTDLAALDATCARVIGMKPEDMPVFKLAEEVVGNTAASSISIVGASLDSLRQQFKPPPTFADRSLLKDAGSFAS